MEKHFMVRLFVSLAATCATTFLAAQDQNRVAANGLKPEQINAIAAALETVSPAPGITTVHVKSKVMRSFLQSFRDATDVKWSEDKGRYFASFNQAGRLGKALFNGQGGLVFSMRYGTEKDLPRDVRKLVKSTYIDYAIDVVTEVDTKDLKAWVVNLSDSDNLVVVSVHDGALTELHHYETHF